MTDRPLPECHEGILKTALKLEPNDLLPDELVQLYWDAERTARRIGCRLDNNNLVTICLLANRTTPADPVSFLDQTAKHGDRVLAKFRGEWRWGVFKARRGKLVLVQIDDDTAEDREFSATAVRRPSKEERAFIGE